MLASIILCALGTWQIYRLEWKQNMLENLEREYQKPAEAIPLALDSISTLSKSDIVRGTLNGTLKADTVIATSNGQNAFNIYSILRLEDEGHLIVRLGTSARIDHDLNSNTPYTITGAARKIPKSWRAGIKNDINNQQWIYLDRDDVRRSTGLNDLPDTVLVAEAITPSIDNITPASERYTPNNNHKQYAFFWFSMCAIMWVVYYARFWRKS